MKFSLSFTQIISRVVFLSLLFLLTNQSAFSQSDISDENSLKELHPLSEVLPGRYGNNGKGNRDHTEVQEMVPAEGRKVVWMSPGVLELGLARTEAQGRTLGLQFGLEIDYENRGEYKGTAFAYSDGSGARGDGRSVMLNSYKTNQGVIDIGLKGSGPTLFKIPLAEVRSGNHIGEVDGLQMTSEFITSAMVGEYLKAVQITSDRMLWGIEINKTTGHNIAKLGIEGERTDIQKAIIGVRSFSNALRLGHISNGVAGYTLPEGSQRNNLLEYIRQREISKVEGEPNLSRTDAFKLGIERWATEAARAQDLFIAHSVPNRSNLTWGGWTDLNYVTGLPFPDPNWGIRTRGPLGYQAALFYQHVRTYWSFFSNSGNGNGRLTLSESEFNKAYWETFKKEITRLTLVRMGLKNAQATSAVESNFDKSYEFTAKYWDLSIENLRTNLNEFMIERLKGRTSAQAISTAQRTNMDIKNHSAEIDPEGRSITFSMSQVLTSAAKNNGDVFAQDRGQSKLQQVLSVENGNLLFDSLTELLGELSSKPSEAEMLALAQRVQKINFPENHQFNGLYEEYKASNGGLQEFMSEIMENGKPNEAMRPAAELSAEITEIYGRQSPFLSATLKSSAVRRQTQRRTTPRRRGAESQKMACKNFMLGLIR